ncbi:MAG: hypothetical protein KF757_06305 [Phycisphaeraceae bacterium]|nr:hypothetical protein [Phycisphaeraceae bacterium]MCW5763215.1 hypothetical protein [Phycisphaeraceae bacterium]
MQSHDHGTRLREFDPALGFPETAEQEAENPGRAHAVYESANELLLSRTRDREQFNLVFEENVNYGYRRNLWAMKPSGILLAAFGFAGGLSRLTLEIIRDEPVTMTAAYAVVLGSALTVFWIVRIHTDWVRVAADAYARQLAAASQSI